MFTPNDIQKQIQARIPGSTVTYQGNDEYTIVFSDGVKIRFKILIRELNGMPSIIEVEEAFKQVCDGLKVERELRFMSGLVNTCDFASLFDHVFAAAKPEVKEPEMEFKDLSDELYRVYEYPDGSNVQISQPTKLNVSKSGGHRVLDNNGISHYIPAGWNHLYWKVKAGKKPFAF